MILSSQKFVNIKQPNNVWAEARSTDKIVNQNVGWYPPNTTTGFYISAKHPSGVKIDGNGKKTLINRRNNTDLTLTNNHNTEIQQHPNGLRYFRVKGNLAAQTMLYNEFVGSGIMERLVFCFRVNLDINATDYDFMMYHGVKAFNRPAIAFINGDLWNWHASPTHQLYPNYNNDWVIYIREEVNGFSSGYMYDKQGNLITATGLTGLGCDFFSLTSKYDVDIHEISFHRIITQAFNRDFHVQRLVSELNY